MHLGRVLIDTGPLVTLFNKREDHYEACSEQAKTLPGRLFTCLPVLTEACYLLNRQDSRLVDLLLASCRDGVYQILPIDASDFDAIRTIRNKYADIAPDIADVTLIRLAEREKITHIFTLDRRDFGIYRTQSNQAFELLPAL